MRHHPVLSAIVLILVSEYALAAPSASLFALVGVSPDSRNIYYSCSRGHAFANPNDADDLNTNSGGAFFDFCPDSIPTPTLTSISPTCGIPGESLTVAIQGKGFIAGTTSVSFGAGIAVESISISNDHSLNIKVMITALATVGPRNVVVSNRAPGGGTAMLIGAFSVVSFPVVTSVSPESGLRGQGLPVLVNGSNFVPGAFTINFGNGISADSVTVLGGTRVRAYITISSTVPSGVRDVSVSNVGPGGAVVLRSGFSILNHAPAITSVVPGSGTKGKILSVAINGSGFFPGVTVVIPPPGITLVSTTFVDASQIIGSLLISKDASLGFGDLTISNSGPGGGSATLSQAFEVQNPAPTLESAFPKTATPGQVLNVVLTGTDFIRGVTNADFGAGISVGSVTMDTTGAHLTADLVVAPTALAGPRNVTVTNSGPGGGTSSLAGAFSVMNLAPALSSLSTYAAGRGQTLNVTLTGANFATGITTASFGVGITVNSLTVSTPTSAVANVTVGPSAIIGARNVSVTNASPGGGTATLVSVFNVANPSPTIASIAPASGARGQTLDVLITGSGFLTGTTGLTLGADIVVNSFAVSSFTQMSANITVAFAASAGARDVSATNGLPGGGAGLLAAGFTVSNPLPTISSIIPASANRGSVLNVAIAGSQFITGATTLNLGPDIIVNSYVIKSPTEIQANISLSSLAASGARTITVTNASPGGGAANLPAGFTVGTGTPTSVEGNLGAVPDDYMLGEAYPNPFNPSTKIRYGVPEDSRVRIVIHNMLGNIVSELVNGERSKGTYELQWHADNLPSGVYLVRMHAESSESGKRYISSRKLVLMK